MLKCSEFWAEGILRTDICLLSSDRRTRARRVSSDEETRFAFLYGEDAAEAAATFFRTSLFELRTSPLRGASCRHRGAWGRVAGCASEGWSWLMLAGGSGGRLAISAAMLGSGLRNSCSVAKKSRPMGFDKG